MFKFLFNDWKIILETPLIYSEKDNIPLITFTCKKIISRIYSPCLLYTALLWEKLCF